jgi:hypothetical protein
VPLVASEHLCPDPLRASGPWREDWAIPSNERQTSV